MLKEKVLTGMAVATILLLSACQSKSYKIEGHGEGLNDNDTLYLTTDLHTIAPTDTVIIKDGKFQISGETDSAYICMIYNTNNMNTMIPFFVEPGNISIEFSKTAGASRIGGTKLNRAWQTLNDSVMTIGKEVNLIAERLHKNNFPTETQQKEWEKIEKLNQRFRNLLIATIEQNINNELGYFILLSYPEEVVSNDERLRLIEHLPQNMRNRADMKELEQFIKKSTGADGGVIGDFEMPSLNGTTVSLQHLIKQNKITIIDFWASWCGPCVHEMPIMVKLYAKYKDKGLGIVGISLDSSREKWQEATKRLAITWPQMSDLKGWDNAAARALNVNSIPHTIIVNQQGEIIKRDLRGAELEALISSLLK